VGAESLEGDLHGTSDGIVVVSHDKTVDRCTEGTGYIKDMTLSEVKALDAGYRFSPDGGTTFPYRGAGYKIPTLEEVFGSPALNRAPMVVEIKQEAPSIVDSVLDIIEDYDMADRIILGSFSLASLNEVRVRAAARGLDIVTSFALDEVLDYFFTPMAAVRAGNYRPVGMVLQVPVDYTLGDLTVQVIRDSFMAKAWLLGLKVQVWTINDPDEMRWLMDVMHVDGIMTDNPQLLESIVME
jgi:glycerophosphoryl diester phosphodiesterase